MPGNRHRGESRLRRPVLPELWLAVGVLRPVPASGFASHASAGLGAPALAKNLLSPATSALPFDAENGAWPTEGGYIRLRLRGEGVTCPLR